MEQENSDLEIGDQVKCINCNTLLPKETKFQCPVCGRRIKFRYLSGRLQSQIISLWIGTPLTATLFIIVLSDLTSSRTTEFFLGIICFFVEILTIIYGINRIIHEFRSERKIWWKILIGFLMMLVELYFAFFTIALVFGF